MTVKKGRKPGRPKSDNPKSNITQVRFDPNDRRRIEKAAETAGLSVSKLIRKVVLQHLANMENDD
jgi:hypothetical protein